MKRHFKITKGKSFENQTSNRNTRPFHEKALNGYLEHLGKTANKTTSQVQKDIIKIWNTHGFKPVAQLNELLIKQYLKKDTPARQAILDLNKQLFPLNPTSGYIDKQCSNTTTALAKLYTDKIPSAVNTTLFEMDFMNQGGTNLELFKRAINSVSSLSNDQKNTLKSLATEEITGSVDFEDNFEQLTQGQKELFQTCRHEARKAADNLIKILSLKTAKIIRKHSHAIHPLHVGGDELRIIAEGLPPQKLDKIKQDIDKEQLNTLRSLDLTSHKHLKKEKLQGCGLALSATNLCDLDPATHRNTSENEIYAHKQKLSNECAASKKKKLPFNRTNFRINFELNRLQKLTKTWQQSVANDNIQNVRCDNLADYSKPSQHINASITAVIAAHGHIITENESHILNAFVDILEPIDPASGTHTPQSLSRLLHSYAIDSLRHAAAANGLPQMTKAAHLVTIELTNLGGLNDCLSYEGANAFLKCAAKIIENNLEEQGIKNAHITHAGGRFTIAIPPLQSKNPATILSQTAQRLVALNNKRINGAKIGSIKSKSKNNTTGINVKTTQHPDLTIQNTNVTSQVIETYLNKALYGIAQNKQTRIYLPEAATPQRHSLFKNLQRQSEHLRFTHLS